MERRRRGLVIGGWALAAWIACLPAPARAAPGEVVSAGPAGFAGEPLLRLPIAGVRATHVLYRSTDVHGATVEVSGTILVPTSPYPGRRPIVGYAATTHGLGDTCAPSFEMAQGIEVESSFLMGLLVQGWAVAVSDYQGLGTPGPHPYMVGPSLGRSVLDAVRAATRLGLPAGGPVAIWGYSEGGLAAAWAGQIQPSYAPELHLVGVAAGGVPADTAVFTQGLDGTPFFGFGVAALMGLNAAFPELKLSRYLNEAGRQIVAGHADDCLGQLLLPPFTLGRYAAITTTDVFARADVQAAFAQSRLGGSLPRAPLLLYHSPLDEIVPYAVGQGLRDRYCGEGATVRWLTYPAAEHITASLEAAPEAIGWLAGRIGGQAAPNDCGHVSSAGSGCVLIGMPSGHLDGWRRAGAHRLHGHSPCSRTH